MTNFPPLDCSQIVFRTVFRKEWIRKDGSLKWQVFKPYFNDKDGVSSFIKLTDIEEHSDKPYFGIATVHVGKVRDCSSEQFEFDVVQDKVWHANICGIPYPYQENGNEDADKAAKMRDACEALIENASRPHPTE